MPIDAKQKDIWLREFHLNGFVVLRNFLPVEFVQQLRDELAPLLETEYAKANKDEFASGRATGRLALHLDQYASLLRGALADDRYQRNAIIEELVDATLGEGQWDRGWTLVEAAWKGASHMAWHSDQKPEDTPDVHGPHQTIRVTFNIPLLEFMWQTGAMEVIPGSHHLPRDYAGIDGISNIHSYLLQLTLGDAIFRDGNILHRGTPNLTDDVRPMLDQTYKKKSA
ncbi:MAG: phytanoyl-CoA dioxygenase family protein [Acidobacteriota bacterium]|nr:phytanoyl-CoA dioxygenase family protein [Acidobacteriota bacterium]MDH3784963.1 phytanoyl-CoA dioxygenase family protein [Acidobacteriota bacterium]